jgi:hypothetical protein
MLLSSNATGGAASPYGNCLPLRTEVEIMIATASGNGIPSALYIVPSTDLSLSGMAATTIYEQPLSTHLVVPISTTSAPIVIRNLIKWHEVAGVSESIYENAPIYSGTAAADPTDVNYIQVGNRSMDGVTNCASYWSIGIKTYYRFFNRNNLASTAPS